MKKTVAEKKEVVTFVRYQDGKNRETERVEKYQKYPIDNITELNDLIYAGA